MSDTLAPADAPADPLAGADLLADAKPAEGQGAPAQDAPADAQGLGASGQELGKAGEQPQATDKPQAGAPEGAYELKAPEGVKLDTDTLAAVTDDLKAANVSPAQAQVLAEKVMPKLTERIAQAIQAKGLEDIGAIRKGWVDEVRADKDLAGDANMAVVAAGRDGLYRMVGQERSARLAQLFKDTGLGSHPDLLHMFKAVGAEFAPGRMLSPSTAAIPRTPEQKRYAEPFNTAPAG